MVKLKSNSYAFLAQNDFAQITFNKVSSLSDHDLEGLSESLENTLNSNLGINVGFHKINYDKYNIEQYFKGVLLTPNRSLIIVKLDNIIAGSIQLIRPIIENTSDKFAINIENYFVAPWARGFDITKSLIHIAEKEASNADYKVIKICIRATQRKEINLYEELGYKKWGTLDNYELEKGKIIAGLFFYKEL